MTIFEEEPSPRAFRDLRLQRVGSVQVPMKVLGPLQRRLRQAWEVRRSLKAAGPAGDAPEPEGPSEGEAPETYGEHGQLIHPHRETDGGTPHVDLKG